MEQPLKLVDTVKEGFLFKQCVSHKGPMEWKKRWFVLGRAALSYHKNPKQLESKFDIPLEGVCIRLAEGKTKRNYTFEISHPQRRMWTLSASSEEERIEWLRHIMQAMKELEMQRKEEEEYGTKDLDIPGASTSPPRTTVQFKVPSSPRGGALNLNLNRPKRTFSLTGEKLLISYRYMKDKLEGQGDRPTIIHIPQGQVYRRFGFGVAISKLLKRYPSLDVIEFTDCRFAGDFDLEFVECLASNIKIRKVSFKNSSSSFKSRAVQDDLPSILPKLPSHITGISFDNNLSKEGVDKLFSLMLSCPSLRSFSVIRNPIKTTKQVQDLVSAAEVLGLTKIYLQGNGLGDELGSLLFDLLSESQSLELIAATDNGLTRYTAEHIAQFILTNLYVNGLDVSNNNLGDSAPIIFNALATTHQRLKALSMARNKITHNSIYDLAKLIQYNHTLTILDLEGNKFREESGKVLLRVLPRNKTLYQFKIDSSSTAEDGSTSTSGAILAAINVRGSCISPEDLNSFKEITDRNRMLESKELMKAVVKERTLRNFRNDYHELLMRLLELLNMGAGIDSKRKVSERGLRGKSTKEMLEKLKETQQYQKCLEFVSDCLEDYNEKRADAFLLPARKIFLGLNGMFVKYMGFMLGTVGNIHKRSESSDEKEIALKEGYLLKRGGRRKNWKMRWFSLNGVVLFYFVDEKKTKRKGMIVLEGAGIATVPHGGGGMTNYTFQVQTADRTYLLSCSTQEERESWMATLQGRLSESQHNSAEKQERSTENSTETLKSTQQNPLLRSSNEQIKQINSTNKIGDTKDLDNIKNAALGLCSLYTSYSLSFPDPQRKLILQWWFPQCLEVCGILYISKGNNSWNSDSLNGTDQVKELLNSFIQNTAVAMYMMLGYYLYDSNLLLAMKGSLGVYSLDETDFSRNNVENSIPTNSANMNSSILPDGFKVSHSQVYARLKHTVYSTIEKFKEEAIIDNSFSSSSPFGDDTRSSSVSSTTPPSIVDNSRVISIEEIASHIRRATHRIAESLEFKSHDLYNNSSNGLINGTHVNNNSKQPHIKPVLPMLSSIILPPNTSAVAKLAVGSAGIPGKILEIKKYPVTIFNALTQSKELRAMLWPVLNEMENSALIDLLSLRKQKIINASISIRNLNDSISTSTPTSTLGGRRQTEGRYEFIPCPELGKDGLSEPLCGNPHSTQKLQPWLTGQESSLLFCIKNCGSLIELYKPTKKFLVFIKWLTSSWPGITNIKTQQTFVLDPREANLVLRFLFILLSLIKSLYNAGLSTLDMKMYNLWEDFKVLSEDLVTHMAIAISKGLRKGQYLVKEISEPLSLLREFSIKTLEYLVVNLIKNCNQW